MKSSPSQSKATLDRVAELAAALADPTRLRLLSLILHTPDICVCDLEAVTEIAQAKISRHLAMLRRAEIVTQRREGTWMHYKVNPSRDPVEKGLLAVMKNAHLNVPELARDLKRLSSSKCCLPDGTPLKSRVVQIQLA